MADHDDALGERLLDFDPQDPAIRERYGAALHATFDHHLSGPRRVQYGAVGLAGLIGCLVCGSLAITEPATMPAAVRGLLALFAFFGLGWTLLAAWVLTRGGGNFNAQRTVAARMAFGFTLTSVIALSLVAFLSDRGAVGMPMLATGLALLILAAVLLIDVRIERSESTIREQILRLEYRLIDLAELIKPPSRDRADQG
jgi:hypothetical protein